MKTVFPDRRWESSTRTAKDAIRPLFSSPHAGGRGWSGCRSGACRRTISRREPRTSAPRLRPVGIHATCSGCPPRGRSSGARRSKATPQGTRRQHGIPPDKRLLRRRECEFEIFRSVEEAVELPAICAGLTTLDDFISREQTVLQRRKARSGRPLELHTREIPIEERFREGVDFQHGPQSEPGKRPDFLFSSQAAYQDLPAQEPDRALLQPPQTLPTLCHPIRPPHLPLHRLHSPRRNHDLATLNVDPT